MASHLAAEADNEVDHKSGGSAQAHAPETTFRKIQPWITLLVRLGAAVAMLWAGFAKVVDIPASVRSVRAYEILPEAVVPFVGIVLPFLEIILGVLLLVGLFIRFDALIFTLMMVAFIIGIIWVWAKGLNIDCGCFGGGGEVEPGETNYVGGLLERLGFLSLGLWLLIFPKSKWSIDGWMRAGL